MTDRTEAQGLRAALVALIDATEAPFPSSDHGADAQTAWAKRRADALSAGHKALAGAPPHPSDAPQADQTTGWPPSKLMQDDSRELSKTLASKPDARLHAREAGAAIEKERATQAQPAAAVQAEPTAAWNKVRQLARDVAQGRNTFDLLTAVDEFATAVAAATPHPTGAPQSAVNALCFKIAAIAEECSDPDAKASLLGLLCEPLPTTDDTWPIAKLVVKDGKPTATFYTPGLPDGEHDVWPCPVSVDADAIAARAYELHDKARMPLVEALELALSEAAPPTQPEAQVDAPEAPIWLGNGEASAWTSGWEAGFNAARAKDKTQ